ncbi:MAG TPA: PTS sugar transporter subunit IIA, partial [Chthoniobacterales bacterium]|nr:PTS sugar transporter subunit IIA [Chthoniobacterales bacterium]
MAIALAELIDPEQITLDLRARTQTEALREIVDLLVAAGKIDNGAGGSRATKTGKPARVDEPGGKSINAERFLNKLQQREKTNSTYAADGVAFPHARTKLVEEIVLGIGRSEAGIPWTGKGEIANLIFLIAVPERLISDYLVVVGAIARATKDRPLRTLLLHAET